jgi:hypothetical protein
VNQALTLFLGSLPSLVSHGRFSCQAQNILLDSILSPACIHKPVSQNRDPLDCFDRLTTGGRQQHGLLPGHPLRMGSAGTRHYGNHVCLSHLLQKLRHLSCVPS